MILKRYKCEARGGAVVELQRRRSTKQLYPFKITWVAGFKSFISALLARCVDPATHFHSRLELKLLKPVQSFPIFEMGSSYL